MKENEFPPRRRPILATLGLVAASLASLWGGALAAVPLHGGLRLLATAAGFAGYVALFGRALGGTGRAAP